LVLTTSFITPTSIGLALLYPTDLLDDHGRSVTYTTEIAKCQGEQVFNFLGNRAVALNKDCLKAEQQGILSVR